MLSVSKLPEQGRDERVRFQLSILHHGLPDGADGHRIGSGQVHEVAAEGGAQAVRVEGRSVVQWLK